LSRVLLTEPRSGGLARAIEESLGEALPWADLDRDRASVDVWLCAGSPPHDALELPALRWIQTGWAGVEGWFRRPEWRSDVKLTRTVGEYPRQIAEYVFGYLLAQELDIPRALDQMRSREWERWTPGSLVGKTLLVVGYGSIGREVAALGRALGMETLGIRRGPIPPEERKRGVRGLVALAECLPRADVIVNLLPLTMETGSFWTRERLGQMRPGSVFVNVSRGATVDEPALSSRGSPRDALPVPFSTSFARSRFQ
jgi:phosphoglycerate dehydrogenase-like enzyme